MAEMEMTVGELIEQLEQMDPEATVRLATQPQYPFEYSISRVAEAEDGICWIGQGEQLGYLGEEARDALEWHR
ncbi:hypothetical protein CLM85_06970 [Streptomyces albidoflavus]|uniref:hypothetical protein n=1 Tax=Streptomyces TaxID=1883 RepID=UPI000BADE1C3|nr:hypothetical protein [Streptomyces albidoflavus]NEE25337.1 hypothetical protein [Streptomyces sp. SID7982]PAX87668.1 hypothetical protein CLM81_05555 [Streptomyces albidoflavus]PAX87877.1 hypothetical protein CLM82_25545 [Streptomyces albidoflavus]PBO15942.1 hypothetical protein CLM83_26875 [Streptomyces albidoflavus]PBO24994.1 hypothetical protein CLM85_06970 [Streptomyces albidoflavus]